ncbi:protein PHLOEM PROTEIN 2-LIKE A9-like [Humulus lupulus]|uniref:protein PHLOEM PROTEIN 2-LIKE A9-like n=1 Tax=Humulus lupulus TaxID=3486 RepID=UPI002B417CF9|nr:protein PHLOEM PROTEIN 2-LIKE A9-like [Humulus lupulus]
MSTTSKAHHDADVNAIISDDKKEFIFYPRGLNIVWGNDSRYWRIPSEPQPRNGKSPTAELIQVSWLEVTGSQNLETGKYKIKFYLSLKSDAFGWNGCQVYLMAKIGRRGKYKWSKIQLKDQNTSSSGSGEGTPFPSDDFEIEVPSTATDDDSKKLYFGLYEVWSGKWKGGLQIHKAVVTKVA